MDANTVHKKLGSFTANERGKGHWYNPMVFGLPLDKAVGKYLGISVDGELIQCCQLKDLIAERDANDNDDDTQGD